MRDVKLGEICAFTRGLTYKKSDEVGFSKNIVLRANNIDLSTNSLLLDDLRYIKDSIKIESEKLVKKNSLIICTASGSKSHLGKVALITEDFGYSFGGFMGQITPSKDCHHRFLFYIFTSPSFKDFLMGLTDGTNINNLKFTDIENYEVRLPKYEDQVKIVMKLDKTFAEIDSLEKNLQLKEEKTNQLLQSMLSAAFTSTVKFDMKIIESTLGDLCEVDWGNTNLTKSSYIPGGKFLAVSASGPDGRIDHYEHDGNIPVLSAIGAQCGKMFFPTEKFTAIKNTITLTPLKNVVDGKYLYYLFTHIELPQRGAGQPFISKGDIQSFKIAIPKDVKDQRVIVEMLDNAFTEIDNLRNQVSIEKERVSSLRQSILSNAFKFEEKAS